jgi:hypothetical protein
MASLQKRSSAIYPIRARNDSEHRGKRRKQWCDEGSHMSIFSTPLLFPVLCVTSIVCNESCQRSVVVAGRREPAAHHAWRRHKSLNRHTCHVSHIEFSDRPRESRRVTSCVRARHRSLVSKSPRVCDRVGGPLPDRFRTRSTHDQCSNREFDTFPLYETQETHIPRT